MPQQKRYKITTRIEIAAVVVDDELSPGYEQHTGERITIDDNITYGDAATLYDALKLIERIHSATSKEAAG